MLALISGSVDLFQLTGGSAERRGKKSQFDINPRPDGRSGVTALRDMPIRLSNAVCTSPALRQRIARLTREEMEEDSSYSPFLSFDGKTARLALARRNCVYRSRALLATFPFLFFLSLVWKFFSYCCLIGESILFVAYQLSSWHQARKQKSEAERRGRRVWLDFCYLKADGAAYLPGGGEVFLKALGPRPKQKSLGSESSLALARKEDEGHWLTC